MYQCIYIVNVAYKEHLYKVVSIELYCVSMIRSLVTPLLRDNIMKIILNRDYFHKTTGWILRRTAS